MSKTNFTSFYQMEICRAYCSDWSRSGSKFKNAKELILNIKVKTRDQKPENQVSGQILMSFALGVPHLNALVFTLDSSKPRIAPTHLII
jgi:hypothetical protein